MATWPRALFGAPSANPEPFVPPVGHDALAHVPGDPGLPVLGHAIPFLTDARAHAVRQRQLYGPVFRGDFLGIATVSFTDPEGCGLLLRDREQRFSSLHGWGFSLGELFPRGLMLRDFDDHRRHRRVMQVAFRNDALERYVARMEASIARSVEGLPERVRFAGAIKTATLNNAAAIFLGAELGPETDALNAAFVATVEASLAVVRIPVPGLSLWRGLRARARLDAALRARLPAARSGAGDDMLAELTRAEVEGEAFDDDAIVDHMIFLLMAAHDTVTSTLTMAAYHLAANPVWQERLREELAPFGETPSVDELARMELAERVVNEVLRLHPPVPFIPRRAMRAFRFRGLRIPANTHVVAVNLLTHRDPRFYPDPDRFDPDRFQRAEHRAHPFAFTPFGGGAHTCIGNRFAMLLAKVVLHRLLRRVRLELPPGYVLRMRELPIPKPADGLPLRLAPLR
jgi:cytochrome P450